MESVVGDVIYCYCESRFSEPYMITCNICKKQFHRRCLKSGSPTTIAGDIYFKFVCSNCSESGQESVERMKLQWIIVTMLALFNLKLEGSGKYGYFRWREDICRFVDRNWTCLFGADRKKAATWPHTVAGVLSANCNRYFMSGSESLGGKGWWALKNSSLPTIEELEAMATINKSTRRNKTVIEENLIVEGSRPRHHNVAEAAQELKAKRTAAIQGPERAPRRKKVKTTEPLEIRITLANEPEEESKYSIPRLSFPSCSSSYHEPEENTPPVNLPELERPIKRERGLDDNATDIVKEWLKQEKSDDMHLDLDMDIDLSTAAALDSNTMNDLLHEYLGKEEKITDINSAHETNGVTVKEEIASDEEIPEPIDISQNYSDAVADLSGTQHIDMGRKRKAVIKEEIPDNEEELEIPEFEKPDFVPLSDYEERQLLSKIESLLTEAQSNVKLRNLYRKLVVRKIKRDNGLPLFDLDVASCGAFFIEPHKRYTVPTNSIGNGNVLDRYQTLSHNIKPSVHRMSFFSRLMGLRDDKQDSIISPYTSRILKPFIYRDYHTVPLKLKLLRELKSRFAINTEDSQHIYPIDYCYVRPQHIPAVNSLCQEFFWPGIDLSECLQYPDFSCVALYRKIIIGFAFMVPDVKCNEAYISFIFCHPDWRRSGIASFMLYHLIQTCMGKDITLHVSATGAAAMLYQKFCFKVEEFVQDFYDKYLPVNSRECRHSLFMRLSR